MASIKNVTTYIDYFRQKAIDDPDLQHNPLGEIGDAPIGSMHFNTWSVDDILTGINTQLGWPALMLELYETSLHPNGIYDIRGYRQGAFTILANQLVITEKARIEAYSAAEVILYRILQKMWDDHNGGNVDQCNTPFEDLDFENMDIVPVGKIGSGQFGWRCEFTFKISNLFTYGN